jgi:predicted DsbA family dithiol-disulfide isomerase
MNGGRRAELLLDIACVQSYLVLTRYLRAAERFRAEGGTVETVFLPFRFRPEAAPEGEPLFATHMRDRGEAAAREIQATTDFGAADGLRVDFTRVVSTNTFFAHRLVAQAAAQGRGEVMAERLFRAYFTDGVNVADPAVLTRLAAEAGVTPREDGTADLLRALERVRERGFTPADVPAVLVDGGPTLNGDHPEEAYHRALAA